MPTLRPVLEESHRLEFGCPPVFNTAQRKHFFQNSEETKPFLQILDSATNQVGFLIQLGYFRATRRFFPSRRFAERMLNTSGNGYDYSLPTLIFRSTRNPVLVATNPRSCASCRSCPFRGLFGKSASRKRPISSLKVFVFLRYLAACATLSAPTEWKSPLTQSYKR
jgi:hypothetical protein